MVIVWPATSTVSDVGVFHFMLRGKGPPPVGVKTFTSFDPLLPPDNRIIRSQVSGKLPSNKKQPLGRLALLCDFTPFTVASNSSFWPLNLQSDVTVCGPVDILTV